MSTAAATSDNTYDKDPGAKLDYGVDWGKKWLSATETIVSSTWDLPDGVTSTADGIVVGGRQTFIWIEAGTVKRKYAIINNIVTSEGREDSRTIFLNVVDR